MADVFSVRPEAMGARSKDVGKYTCAELSVDNIDWKGVSDPRDVLLLS